MSRILATKSPHEFALWEDRPPNYAQNWVEVQPPSNSNKPEEIPLPISNAQKTEEVPPPSYGKYKKTTELE